MVVNDYLTAFCESSNIENNDIKFKSKYLDFLIVNCTKREITELSNNSQVERLSLYKNENPTSAQWSTAPIISADSYSGIGGSSFNNGSGYDGTGITIGIIEAEYGKYKENDYNLNTAHNNNLFYVQTNNIVGNPGNHATNVTAIICGKKPQ